MRIKKIYQGELPQNKIVNEKLDSQTDTYSCDYINNLTFEGGEGVDELPIDSIIEYEGETVPDGWELVEGTETDERNYIQCELTDRLNIPDTNYVLVPFDDNLIMGGAFTYDESTNEVVIDSKSNIDKVKIHFHAIMSADSVNPVSAFEVLVYRNSDIVLVANETMETGSSRTAVSVDRVVECAPGDRFRVEIKSYDNLFILLNTYGRTVFSLEDMTNVTVNNVTIEAKEKNYIQCGLSQNIEGVDYLGKVIDFDQIVSNGDLFYMSSNSTIKVNENATSGRAKIHIHAGAETYDDKPIGNVYFMIWKNDVSIGAININLHAAKARNQSSIEVITDYVAGDTFHLSCGTSENKATVMGTYNRTMMSIEEITDTVTTIAEYVGSDNYSTEETVIGTWFGKPLYRKTIDFGYMEKGTVFKHVPHNVENVDKIWIDKSNSYFVDANMNFYDVSDYDWHTSVNATNVSGVVSTNDYDRTTSRMYVTIKYTKTTD